MHISFRDRSEKKGGREKLLIADLSALKIAKVKVVLVSSVVAVADDRVTEVGKLRADLVSTTGNEFDLDIGNIFAVRSDRGEDF